MTRRLSLGPILAGVGLVVIVGAVIVGFIVTGGPDSARDLRFDALTKGRLMDIANIARCAYNGVGMAPASIDDAVKAQGSLQPNQPPEPCSLGVPADHRAVVANTRPTAPGAISYEKTGANQIRLCAVFRRPSPRETCNGICARDSMFAELDEPRPTAGLHCTEIALRPISQP